MEGLGRLFNVVPIAAGKAINLRHGRTVTFVCTGNDTFTLTCSDTFGGSYVSPGNIIVRKRTNTATDGTAAWVKATQAAADNVVISSGAVAVSVDGDSLPDGKVFLKCSAAASGLVAAILHDLYVQREPANLPKVVA